MSNFKISDLTYNDSIVAHPFHYNSMRSKPAYPIGLIESNISSVRPFSQKWLSNDRDEPNRLKRHFPKRTLFNASESDRNIHLASLSVLTQNHLIDKKIDYPREDDFHRFAGHKKHVLSRRNNIDEKKPGDNTYRTPEYSRGFYSKKNRNWRSEYYELPKKNEEILTEELIQMLQLNPNMDLFPTKFDFGYENDKEKEKKEDIIDVLDLNAWKNAQKLEIPFKVLDLPEKALRYRPRVNR